ncbi:hypothetical protein MMC32_008343 [Xylographa parallela]|nr:hypothetical protein [Xylographa parallela]
MAVFEPLDAQTLSSAQSLKHKRSISDAPPKNTASGKKRRKKTTSLINDDLDFENGINSALGRLNSSLLADYFIQRTKTFAKDLSLVDLDEKRIPVHAVRETGNWQRPRILVNLPEFIEEFSSRRGQFKDLASSPEEKGSPHTIVVTAAGLRAANITRSLRKFETKDAIVAKLFAKHKKLINTTEYVRKTRQVPLVPWGRGSSHILKIGIGVGTPARLVALLDSGSLSTDKLERIVVDFSHIDQKKRGILDMKETFEPLVQLLTRTDLKRNYIKEDEGVDLLFF